MSKEENKEVVINMDGLETIDDSHITWKSRLHWFWNDHSKKIIFVVILLLAGVIAIVVSIQQSKSNEFPCLSYTSSSYASSVTVKCLQFMWDASSCVSKGKPPIPDNYNGYYLRSPQGGLTILCSSSPNCGAGNFGTIQTDFSLCIMRYP